MPYSSTRSGPNELLAKARNGDQDALGRLLDLYRNYLHLLAQMRLQARLQGKLSSSDLVHETYVQAVRHFDEFRGDGEKELMAWLRSILVTTALNTAKHYRTQGHDIRLERQLHQEMDASSMALERGLVGDGPTPPEEADRREQAVLLADALGELNGEQREVLVLRNLEGLTFPEVAERMSRSVDAVKRLWKRALLELRRVYGVKDEEP